MASKSDGVVVAAGEDRRPGRGAQGRGVEVGELEAAVGEALHRGGADGGGAVRRRLREAAVVQDLHIVDDARRLRTSGWWIRTDRGWEAGSEITLQLIRRRGSDRVLLHGSPITFITYKIQRRGSDLRCFRTTRLRESPRPDEDVRAPLLWHFVHRPLRLGELGVEPNLSVEDVLPDVKRRDASTVKKLSPTLDTRTNLRAETAKLSHFRGARVDVCGW